MKRRTPVTASTDWLTVRLPSFFAVFSGGGVSRMLAGGADRIWSGSSTNLTPLEYSGFGPEQKGAVSCWDAESGLEVMGRREKEHCLWRGTKWITAIFLLLCLTVRVESGGPDNKGTEPQTKAKWRTAQEKKIKLSGWVNIMSFMMICWTYDEVILISVLTSAQTVEQGGGNDWNIFLYFFILLILRNSTWYQWSPAAEFVRWSGLWRKMFYPTLPGTFLHVDQWKKKRFHLVSDQLY